MNAISTQVWSGLAMLGVTVALVSGYVAFLRRGSARRLVMMMRRIGLDPSLLQKPPPQSQAVVEAIWRRCRHCQLEGLCDRWLDGEVGGDSSFCPNTGALRLLTHRT